MNIKRGAFRLWAALSLIWVVPLTFIFLKLLFDDLTRDTQELSKADRIDLFLDQAQYGPTEIWLAIAFVLAPPIILGLLIVLFFWIMSGFFSKD